MCILFQRKDLEHLKSLPSVYLTFDSISQTFQISVNACTEISLENKILESKVTEMRSLALEVGKWHCCNIILRESNNDSIHNNPDSYSLDLLINNKLQNSIQGIFKGYICL